MYNETGRSGRDDLFWFKVQGYYCLLPVACCLLPIAYCLLPIA